MPELNNNLFEGASLPFSNEAEQAVLCSVLIDPPSINNVIDILKPDCFYIPQNRRIFEILIESIDSGLNNEDFVTILEKIKNDPLFKDIGAKAYLTSLIEAVPSSANIETYANIIRDKYYMRSLVIASRDIVDKASDTSTKADKLLDYAEQKIYDIRQGREVAGLVKFSDVIKNETIIRLNNLADPEKRKDYIGIPTGISGLDSVITGLHKSDLIILGARPGMGKTSFALNIARNAAINSGKTVVVFSLEMTRDQLVQRMISGEARIKSEKFRTGELDGEELVRFGQAAEKFAKADIYLDETPGITVPEIKAKLLRMKKPADLVIIDYLGLMQSAVKTENRVQEISGITRKLKQLAKDFAIPVLVCSQLSRGTESKGRSHKPALSDLRESGSIEQDADIVLFIYRDKYYDSDKKDPNEVIDEHKAECIVAKNRHGTTKTVDLYWDGQFTKFTSVANFDE